MVITVRGATTRAIARNWETPTDNPQFRRMGSMASSAPAPPVAAAVLHLMGLDHKRLTYRHNGRSYRLTDVAGEVIQTILA